MRIGCIIQARSNSSRLPNKIFLPLPIDGKKSVIEWVVSRIRKIKEINEIVIATTLNKEDNQVELLSKQINVNCYRGSEKNVLSRYYESAIIYNFDVIVRVTSDNPCIDPKVVEILIKNHIQNNNDYTVGESLPIGIGAEIISLSALKKAFHLAKDSYDIEHVTSYIYLTEKEKFKVERIPFQEKEEIRITLDSKEDYMSLGALFDYLKEKPDFLLQDIVDLYNAKPWLHLINNSIVQKKKYHSLDSEMREAINLLQKQDLFNVARILENHNMSRTDQLFKREILRT